MLLITIISDDFERGLLFFKVIECLGSDDDIFKDHWGRNDRVINMLNEWNKKDDEIRQIINVLLLYY